MSNSSQNFRYRCIKPLWGRKTLGKKKTPNPEYKRAVEGPDVYEGHFEREKLDELNKLGYHIYFFPNGTKTPYKENYKINGKHINKFDYVFVDMDLKDGIYPSKEEFIKVIEKYKNRPHIIVDSGNGIHVYWKVKNATRDEYMIIQKALIHKFNTDKSIWTVMQLMRYPGYLNTKEPNNFKPANKITPFAPASSDSLYKYGDFEDLFPLVTKEDDSDIKQHADALDGKIQINYDLPQTNDLPEQFLREMEIDLYLKSLFYEPEKTMGGDRSRADFNLAYRLKRLKYSKEDIFAIIYNGKKASARKGHQRATYAQGIINKLFQQEAELFVVPSVSEFLNNKDDDEYLGRPVNGPSFLDCLGFQVEDQADDHDLWRDIQWKNLPKFKNILGHD